MTMGWEIPSTHPKLNRTGKSELSYYRKKRCLTVLCHREGHVPVVGKSLAYLACPRP